MSEELNFSGEEIEPVSRKSIGVKALYAAKERDRVEKIKADLKKGWGFSYEYEQKRISTQPSFLRKIARLAGDAMGIKSKKDEKRREGEAIHIALTEHEEEEEARIRAWQEEDRRRSAQLEENRKKWEIERAAREEEQLEKDIVEARNVIDYNKRDRIKKQRAQEIVERDLNKRLLNIDDLDDEVLAENPEINKRSISFGETEIPVYDLNGLPFSVLSTTIDYRSVNKDNPNHIGIITYQNVMDNPEIWAQRRDGAENSSGFGTRDGNARGDTISTSYWNSEKNIDSHVRGELIYGFSKVEADSIINISNGDGGTSNMAGRAETSVSNLNSIDNLESADGASSYNEILLRRYSENGVPKKPDYIITEDNKISEVAFRHAAFYNIPIVNVNNSSYHEKAQKRGKELIESISEKDSYEELEKKMSELLSMSRYKHAFWDLEGIGRRYDNITIADLPSSATDFQKKCLEISKMEQLKRLDFIKDILVSETQKINAETEKGLRAPDKPSQFEYFDVSIDDLEKGIHSSEYFDNSVWRRAPGNCSEISIDFRLKGDSRRHETRVYDGENIYQFDEAKMYGHVSDEDLKQADSSWYKTLEPIVRAYIDARRKNHEIS